MLTLDYLENLEVYKQPIYLPTGEKEKNKGIMILLNTKNFSQSKKIMKDKMFKYKLYYQGYYYNGVYKLKLLNQTYNEIRTQQRSDYYTEVRRLQNIQKTYTSLKQYNNVNLYYDLSTMNELFFKSTNHHNYTMIQQEYTKMWFNLLNQINELTDNLYKEILIITDLSHWGKIDPKKFKRDNVDNPISLLYNMMRYDNENFRKLNVTFLFRDGDYTFKCKPSETKENDYTYFVSAIVRELKSQKVTIENNETIKSNVKIKTIPKKVTDEIESSNILSADLVGDIKTGSNEKSKVIKAYATTNQTKEEAKLEKMVTDKTKEIIEKSKNDNEDTTRKEVIAELSNDDKFLEQLDIVQIDHTTDTFSSPSNLARNKELAKKQIEIKVGNKTVGEILKDNKEKMLQPHKFKVKTLNKKVAESTVNGLDRTYNKKLYNKDIISVINFFSTRSIPLYIRDIKTENTSDNFTKKSTWTVKFEAANRTRHTLTFDMPIFVNDTFLYIGGNKKVLLKQLVLKPVSKTKADEVQISTSYNKVFLKRTGGNMSPKTTRLLRILPTIKSNTFNISVGNSLKLNKEYITTISFDELAKSFYSFGDKDRVFIFDVNFMKETCRLNGINFKENTELIPFYIDTDTVYYLNNETGLVEGTELELEDFIVNEIDSKISKGFKKEFLKGTSSKKFVYAEATIASKKVPVVFLLSYLEGLSTILKKAKINHKFVDKKPVFTGDDKVNKNFIAFNDGYLIYDLYPMSNSLLMNGWLSINTKDFNYRDFDNRAVYVSIFDSKLGNRRIGKIYENFYDLLLDPITLNACDELNIPKTFTELFIYAINLLEDNSSTSQTSTSISRARSGETVVAILYKELATAYERFRGGVGTKGGVPFSLEPSKVMKETVMLKTVEDYSTINPITEAEKMRAISFKGHRGMNLEQAFTLKNRAFDDSMIGNIAIDTPPTGSVGIVKQLSWNPNIISSRGYMKDVPKKDLAEVNNASIAGPAEMLVPFSTQKDDGQRIDMMCSQSKHLVPCEKLDPLIVGTGVEKALAYSISDDFAFKAKKDGRVVEINDKSKTMVVKYSDGTTDLIELYPKVGKNGGGGFYISTQLITDLVEGDKFEEGEVIAWNKDFFKKTLTKDIVYKAGSLTKIALMQGYFTYEDSCLITQKLSSALTTFPVKHKSVIMGPKSNINHIAKVGQKVEVGDILLMYDESYDNGIGDLLAGIGDEEGTNLATLGKQTIKSKVSGVVEAIKVYYTCPEAEMSESMRKTVKQINRPLKEIERQVKSHKIDTKNLIIEPTQQLSSDVKVKGKELKNEVMIEFYIKYKDSVKIGDKVTAFTALKSVACDIIDPGLEPYSLDDPSEEISYILSPASVQRRMCASLPITAYSNKVFVDLKKMNKKIWFGQ